MPQLNPEFFISQLFWLAVTFTFLFIFLWRISLPRIKTVMDKRERKINDDIAAAKELQEDAEKIQKNIDDKLKKSKSETQELIKNTTNNFINKSAEELEKLDKDLESKINKSTEIIEKNKIESLNKIHSQLQEITKLTFSKITKFKVSNADVDEAISSIRNSGA
tara:strand:- start:273 stop:764 length:492 start_codon:yes stop_codon:yes gene_type:complete